MVVVLIANGGVQVRGTSSHAMTFTLFFSRFPVPSHSGPRALFASKGLGREAYLVCRPSLTTPYYVPYLPGRESMASRPKRRASILAPRITFRTANSPRSHDGRVRTTSVRATSDWVTRRSLSEHANTRGQCFTFPHSSIDGGHTTTSTIYKSTPWKNQRFQSTHRCRHPRPDLERSWVDRARSVHVEARHILLSLNAVSCLQRHS